MICPYCNNISSPKPVRWTRTLETGNVKRGRRCSRCKKNFMTVEMVLVSRLWSGKKVKKVKQ